MQERTPQNELYEARKPKRVEALKGPENFVYLLRSRPLASWQSKKVYASLVATQNETNVLNTNARIQLGQIVPKKLFPLAVDRNRVRRLARAQAQALAATLNSATTIQILLKLSPTKKVPGVPKNAQTAPPQNPHTRAFSIELRASMTQAVERISSAQATSKAMK
jgi:ribonuclease P protein component